MKRVILQENRFAPDPEKVIWIMPLPGLASRLGRAFADTAREVSGGPVSYLGAAFLPDRAEDFFWIRIARLIAASLAHPLETLKGAAASDAIALKRRRRFIPILSVSAGVHGVLIVWLVYLAFFSAFAHMSVVNKAYRKFDPNTLLAKLYYPPQLLRASSKGPAMTLDEIRARAEKHKHELALAKERAETEKKEKEEVERKAAEEAAKVAAQSKPADPPKLGEINVAPIKDTVGNLFKLFDAGGLDIAEVRFSVMCGFRVLPDGSFDNIRIIKSSGSKIIDSNALEILSNLGESHALGAVANLSSATISLDITDDIARIRIMAFAPTPEIAKEKSDLLNVLFWALRMKEQSPDLGQLLKLIKVKSEGKRVDTDLIVPRAKAAEMFRAWAARPSAPSQ
jgi:hypothetical protein